MMIVDTRYRIPDARSWQYRGRSRLDLASLFGHPSESWDLGPQQRLKALDLSFRWDDAVGVIRHPASGIWYPESGIKSLISDEVFA